MQSSFQTLSRRFVGFNDACIFSLASIGCATGFPVLSSPDLARHCCWHRNFQLSPRVFSVSLKLLIRWINEVNTAQSSGVVKLRFLDSQLLFFFSLRFFWHLFPSLWPSFVRPWCRLFLRQSLRVMYAHLEVFLPIKWIVRTLSTNLLGLGLRRFSNNPQRDVQASHPRSWLLLWSMYRSGFGNDSFDTYSLTLGSTWWR